jgi:hypothetical protein
MMEAAEKKEMKNKKLKREPVLSSSVSAKSGDVYQAVAGFIESDKCTVSGGLIASCCSIRWDSHCLFRVSSKHVIVIVNSEHCKWCKGSSSTPVKESEFDQVRTKAYLRGMFQMTLSDSMRISELIFELTRTQPKSDSQSFPVTCTPPYCTVETVTHISGVALQKPLEFDKEFVWGDNLIFNTKVDHSHSGSY